MIAVKIKLIITSRLTTKFHHHIYQTSHKFNYIEIKWQFLCVFDLCVKFVDDNIEADNGIFSVMFLKTT